jgi:hypothetical protein
MEEAEEFPEEFSKIVLGAHKSLSRRRNIEEVEKELIEKISVEGEVRLSKLWLTSDCHLWEIVYALNRLKEKGLVEEKEV